MPTIGGRGAGGGADARPAQARAGDGPTGELVEAPVVFT